MRGVSRTSLQELQERFDDVVRDAVVSELSDELFAVADLFDREHGLRRTLSDPARPPAQKAQAVQVLLEGKVSEAALRLAVAAVEAKWARSADLPDAFERLGVFAAAEQAQGEDNLDEVEDELFRFGRIVDRNPELRGALSASGATPERKTGLLDALLADKVAPATLRLVTQLALHPRGRSLERGLDEYVGLVAERQRRLIAVVRSAVPLGEEQRERLATWLRGTYGSDVHLNVEVDPQVLGGFSVRIGDEIIDTTIAGRIDEVRRRLAG